MLIFFPWTITNKIYQFFPSKKPHVAGLEMGQINQFVKNQGQAPFVPQKLLTPLLFVALRIEDIMYR
jgi:hypothetical protein